MALSKPKTTPHFISQNNRRNPPVDTADSRLSFPNKTRRRFVIVSGTLLIYSQMSFDHQRSSSAISLDLFNFVEPEPDRERTIGDARIRMKKQRENLHGVKEMMEKKQWKEGQKQLRKSAANMKQDLYSIIQAKSPKERPLLRKLYSILFNTLTRMDYAARDEDTTKVLEYYDYVNTILDDIFSHI